MIRRLSRLVVALLTIGPSAVGAQAPLTLTDAIAAATSGNPDVRIAALAEAEAAERVTQARAGYLPRADVTEGWQRGTQPVFVFGSLLAQGRFTADDFALDALNRPDALDNFRAAVSVEQTLYDGGQTRARVSAARTGLALAASGRRRASHLLAVAATEAYGQVLVAEASVRAAEAALAAADADRERAIHRRDAGLVTDADVLAVEVHRAAVEEELVRARAAVRIGFAELNRVMGAPLDTVYALAPPVAPAPGPPLDVAALEAAALSGRPEAGDSRLREQLAAADVDAARASFRPRVVVQGAWETNGNSWTGRAGSWIVGAGVQWNLFRGLADRARVAEAEAATERRALEREQVLEALRVDVRRAVAELEAAQARQALAARIVAQAEERQRIVRDRYDQGLAESATLIQAAEQVGRAALQQVRARVDAQIATARLDRVIGR